MSLIDCISNKAQYSYMQTTNFTGSNFKMTLITLLHATRFKNVTHTYCRQYKNCKFTILTEAEVTLVLLAETWKLSFMECVWQICSLFRCHFFNYCSINLILIYHFVTVKSVYSYICQIAFVLDN